MISKWKVALISSLALAAMLSAPTSAGMIRRVSFQGTLAIPPSELENGSYLKRGYKYSDSLMMLEVSRIDSIYFSSGRLAVSIEADTVALKDGIDVRFAIIEGEVARVGKISVTGARLIGDDEAASRVSPGAGRPFDPSRLQGSLEDLLELYNESGYPYAQVWLAGFTFRGEENEVDLAISISEGEESTISRVVFEGIAKTDSSVALRTSRLKPGSRYDERVVASAYGRLRASGYFESVGGVKLERGVGGAVDVIIPVKEIERGNLFQGALGFSRENGGKYILNGAVELGLTNIAGKGRNVHFDWLNDGRQYSRLNLVFREPFLFSTLVRADAELSQVIQDTVYLWHSGGIYLGFPLGIGTSIIAGAGIDRNVPGSGDLVRSVRERFRVGFVREASFSVRLAFHVEGAYRKSYLQDGSSSKDGQMLYRLDAGASLPSFGDQSIYIRLASEAVFSNGEVPLAEMFPLGGAKTLRGYRENQFRGEKIAFTNVEYRFGEGGWLFLFDDVGAFYRGDEGWTVRNGAGFGLRSESPLGDVTLSFGVGEELSLEGTRIHILLAEKF